jgi:excisionase family DNA binding protein
MDTPLKSLLSPVLAGALTNARTPSEFAELIGELEKAKALATAKMISCILNEERKNATESSLLSIPEVARRLSVPVSFVYELARRHNGLPTIRIGKYKRVDPEALNHWLGKSRTNAIDG